MYQLLLSPGAEKALVRLKKPDSRLFRQLIAKLDLLLNDPFLGKALVGNLKGYYSYRVRDYRILYAIESDRLQVLQIEHRKQVYR